MYDEAPWLLVMDISAVLYFANYDEAAQALKSVELGDYDGLVKVYDQFARVDHYAIRALSLFACAEGGETWEEKLHSVTHYFYHARAFAKTGSYVEAQRAARLALTNLTRMLDDAQTTKESTC